MADVKLSDTQKRLIDLGIISLLSPCGNATDCHTFRVNKDKLHELCANVTAPSEDWTYQCYKVNGEDTYFTEIVSLANPGCYIH